MIRARSTGRFVTAFTSRIEVWPWLSPHLLHCRPNSRPHALRAVPVYWHLLSLDAPTLAVLWAWSLARAVGAPVSWPALAVLGLGTWLLYIADRLLDSRSVDLAASARAPFFPRSSSRRFLFASAGALTSLSGSFAVMPPSARREDILVSYRIHALLRRCSSSRPADGVLLSPRACRRACSPAPRPFPPGPHLFHA